MKHLKTFIFLAFTFLSIPTWATTWDEPWQEKVTKEADYFVFAKVKSFDEKKGVKIEIIKSLGGQELKGQLLKILETASTQENGFGGNLMDPRVCTFLPNVKDALDKLILSL
jgi:hypothetical protein